MNQKVDVLPKTRNFVSATQRPSQQPIVAYRPALPAQQHTAISIDVPASAIQTVEIKTNSVDRAKGYLISSIPRTFAFALTVAIVAIVAGGVGALTALVILFAVWSACELASYGITLLLSAEGVSYYEARRKWNVIEREQSKRWEHYEKEG